MSVVLMYHALYRDESDLQSINVEDQPYAVSLERFNAQMALVASKQHGLISTRHSTGEDAELPEIVVTFDDGHISNVELALPVLLKWNIRAYFFVTTNFIGSRAHFCDWDDLAKLRESGMIVGSHGVTHRFFDDMTEKDMQYELEQSKVSIESQLDCVADSLSYPGGRYNYSTLRRSKALGFTTIFDSRYAVLDKRQNELEKPLPRIPIRRTTSLAQFRRVIDQDKMLFTVERIKSQGKQILKRALGNRLYHGLYTTIAKSR